MSTATPTRPRFAIIGAGMSGILTGIRLKEKGLTNFTIYEKAATLGGTWRENTYPGVACDVPSHVYCYSFELSPDWSRRFSPGPEIRDYFERVAVKHGIDRHIRYDSRIDKVEFRDGRWELSGPNGLKDTADFVVAATGVLHVPVVADIPGLKDFAGASFHTARWDHSVDLAGKRVGIVGTGSTAIQIVPAIVDKVKSLSLFQRTAQWILPLPNPFYTEEEKRLYRENPDMLRQHYEHWAQRFNETFARAVLGDEVELGRIEKLCRDNLEDNVRDPALKARLTPNYRAACKRLIMSDEFYPAIQKPNAHLVTEAIERVEPQGVRTKDGVLHELDVLVIATGFNGHAFLRPMEVVGPHGNRLDEYWKDSNRAYRSVAVPGFPNFFMLVGPNSPIGNFSVIMISEMQVDYMLQLVDAARAAGRPIAPSHAATDRFNAAIRSAMQGTVWQSGCKSWYFDKNGNVQLWPWSFEQFVEDMKKPDLRDFELVGQFG
ncbi:MAG: flavin-containing monooxygenase [Reyranellaceae bacterium]